MNDFIRAFSEIARLVFRNHDKVIPFLGGGLLALWARGTVIASTIVPVPNAFICFVVGGICGLAFWRQIYVDGFTDRNNRR
jgi:hypothetical protein